MAWVMDRPSPENHSTSHKPQKAQGHVDQQQLRVSQVCKMKFIDCNISHQRHKWAIFVSPS